jgi:hypothetical protein
MKNPVFVDREVVDMLGTFLKSGDILSYSSKHAMRIAIFLGIIINKKGDPSITLLLVNEEEPDGQVITIKLWNDPYSNGKVPAVGDDTTVIIEKAIFLNNEFHINNKIVQNAMQIIDNLKDDGFLK